jgi:diguanylate cyclase (GGDEF)-like protein
LGGVVQSSWKQMITQNKTFDKIRKFWRTSFFYEKPADQIKDLLSRNLILVCILWAAVIFAIDLSVSSYIAVAVPYIGLILMGLWLSHRFYILIATVGSILLTILGFMNSPTGEGRVIIYSNLFISLLAIVVTGILCHLYKREEAARKISYNDLEKRVVELSELKEKFEIFAKTDPLTDLPNRRAMNEKLDYEVLRLKRNKKPFVIVMADIDEFKKINDTYGHDVGDDVLVRVAKVFKDMSRRTDIICRWGGEEFLALLPETDLKGGIFFAEKLRSKIEKTCFNNGQNEISVTMSFGVGVYSDATRHIDSCIKQADTCLYEAKKTGRNKVVATHAVAELVARSA